MVSHKYGRQSTDHASDQVDERVFISGQIGLIPSSLSLPSPPSIGYETALSSQHVDRVVKALQNTSGGGWDGHAQNILYWFINEHDVPLVKRALGNVCDSLLEGASFMK